MLHHLLAEQHFKNDVSDEALGQVNQSLRAHFYDGETFAQRISGLLAKKMGVVEPRLAEVKNKLHRENERHPGFLTTLMDAACYVHSPAPKTKLSLKDRAVYGPSIVRLVSILFDEPLIQSRKRVAKFGRETARCRVETRAQIVTEVIEKNKKSVDDCIEAALTALEKRSGITALLRCREAPSWLKKTITVPINFALLWLILPTWAVGTSVACAAPKVGLLLNLSEATKRDHHVSRSVELRYLQSLMVETCGLSTSHTSKTPSAQA